MLIICWPFHCFIIGSLQWCKITDIQDNSQSFYRESYQAGFPSWFSPVFMEAIIPNCTTLYFLNWFQPIFTDISSVFKNCVEFQECTPIWCQPTPVLTGQRLILHARTNCPCMLFSAFKQGRKTNCFEIPFQSMCQKVLAYHNRKLSHKVLNNTPLFIPNHMR